MLPSCAARIDGIAYVFFVPVFFIVMLGVFVVIVLGALCEVYRSYRKHKKRQEKDDEEVDASIMWSQPAKYKEPLVNSGIKMMAYKTVS